MVIRFPISAEQRDKQLRLSQRFVADLNGNPPTATVVHIILARLTRDRRDYGRAS